MSAKAYQQKIIERLVTSEELLALTSEVPMTLIPAPGVGKAIELISVVFSYVAGETPYELEESANLSINMGEFLGIVTWGLDILTGEEDNIQVARAADHVMVENQSVTATYGGGNPTAGDGRLRIKLWYAVHNVDAEDVPDTSGGNPYSPKT